VKQERAAVSAQQIINRSQNKWKLFLERRKMTVMNAFHPDYIKTYHPELLSTIRTEATQEQNGRISGSKTKATREATNKGAFTIATFPKTKAKIKKVSTELTQFYHFSKAGTANVTPKGKKK
jgi:hypothetical protein